ncbi:Rho termination factor [bacterium]|jgi:hypothetical protein|nr:Rho termination factor [bacterium]
MPGKRSPGPSVKDPERYEALRDEGMSKQKAARIANSDPKSMAHHRSGDGKYEEWSKDEIYAKAQDVGIKGRSKMNKGELIDALRHG